MNFIKRILRLNTVSKQQWQKILIVIVIGALAFALRGYLAVVGQIEVDEEVYADGGCQYASAVKQGDWNFILETRYNYEHPFFNKLLYGAVLLPFKGDCQRSYYNLRTGALIWDYRNGWRLLALRAVPVTFGSAAALLLAVINPIAGLFLAIHTFAIKYTSIIYLEGVPMCMSLVSVWAFSRFLKWDSDPPSVASRRKAWLWLAVSAAALGIAAASKYVYGTAGIAILLYALIWMGLKRRLFLPKLIAWGLLSLAFFFVADPFLWPDPIGRLSASILFHINFSTSKSVGWVKEANFPVWQPLLWLSLPIPQHSTYWEPFQVKPGDYFILADSFIMALAVLGIPRAFKRTPLFLTWFIVEIAFLLIWKTKWSQYVTIALPPLCMTASQGLETVSEMVRRIRGKIRPSEAVNS
jgi:hypothetical protein